MERRLRARWQAAWRLLLVLGLGLLALAAIDLALLASLSWAFHASDCRRRGCWAG
jgi:hypothetical protein